MKLIKKEELFKKIVMADNTEILISQVEFEKFDLLLADGQNRGFIKTRNGEWVNLAFVTKITNVKSNYSC